MSKPSIPKGTRDFLPNEMAKRKYIFGTIESVFKKYGFLPIETPSMEKTETLMGKYGEEGDRLIFKIIESGDPLSNYEKKLISSFENDFNSFLLDNLTFLVNNSLDNEIKLFVREDIDVYYDSGLSSEFKDNYYRALDELKLEDRYGKQGFLLKKVIKNNLYRFSKIIFEILWFNPDFNYENDLLDDLMSYLKKSEYFKNLVKEQISNLFKEIKSIQEIGNLSSIVSQKALRYDLTVPFARFVVQNQNEITFPFKRYQIQPVWRADRPQRGRYREFYQCDVDIIGSNSLLNEVELVQIFDDVLTDLNLTDFTIKINNRKILSGIAEVVGEKEKIIDITVAIDKLDKIGVDKVKEELRTKEVSEEAIEKLTPLLTISGSNEELISTIEALIAESEEGRKGVEELKEVLSKVAKVGLQNAKIEFTPSLARGLNYYTGAIFEVSAGGVKIGSICGGGRYDDLTSIFGLKGISGVGISFGADRIYDVLEELNLFPETITTSTKIMFVNFGELESTHCLSLVKQLRNNNISAELYPDDAKMKKQMTYANNKSIPYVALIGTKEIENNSLTVKNMVTGEQNEYSLEGLIKELT